MMSYYPFRAIRIGFLGTGRIAENFVRAYLDYSPILKENIFISGRNLKKTGRMGERFQVQVASDNSELLNQASVIFICVKPFDAEELFQTLKSQFQSHHTILSLMAGVSFKRLQSWGLKTKRLVRLMPNIAVCIGRGFLPFCSLDHQTALNSFVENLLKPLGQVLVVEKESLLSSATVGSASGLGFVLELMEYWQEWLMEEGFSYPEARDMVARTFLGASELAEKRKSKKFSDLQKEVLSRRGVTEEGLRSMRVLELERVLRLSFEKAKLHIKSIEEKV